MGRALAADLVKHGYQVIFLSRNPEKASRPPQGVSIERWDGRTAEGWGHLANGAASIVNLAGENIGIPPLPWWLPGRKATIRASRSNAGRAVVEAVRQATVKPRVVVQASGINYYGLHGDQVVTEKDGPGDDFAARVCIEWEASTEPVEALGVRRVVLRIAPNLTARGGILSYLTLPFKLFMGGPLGNARQWFSWIHTVDQIRAIRFLIDHQDARGVYNVSAPDPKTNADFGRLVAHQLHRPYWFPVPAILMRLVFGELGDKLLLGSLRIHPERLLQAGFQFKYPTASSALADLLRPASNQVRVRQA
jgi:uncharacterized protein (TIGR01777 family)